MTIGFTIFFSVTAYPNMFKRLACCAAPRAVCETVSLLKYNKTKACVWDTVLRRFVFFIQSCLCRLVLEVTAKDVHLAVSAAAVGTVSRVRPLLFTPLWLCLLQQWGLSPGSVLCSSHLSGSVCCSSGSCLQGPSSALHTSLALSAAAVGAVSRVRPLLFTPLPVRLRVSVSRPLFPFPCDTTVTREN